VINAYTAAETVGGNFQLFLSFDMSAISNPNFMVNLVRRVGRRPPQFIYKNLIFVSTFAGENMTFGHSSVNEGWKNAFKQPLKDAGYETYFCPSWTGIGGKGIEMEVSDCFFSWDAWPYHVKTPMDDDDDVYFQNLCRQLGKAYMFPLSPWFYTHINVKNWLYYSDELLMNRLRQMLKSKAEFVQIISFNDYGESHHLAWVHGSPYPGSEQYCFDTDHEGWVNLMRPWLEAYRLGRDQPSISVNKLFVWYRYHPRDANATSDPYGKPQHWEWPEDKIFAVVYATQAVELTITSGSSTITRQCQPGYTEVTLERFQVGVPQFVVRRSGQVVFKHKCRNAMA